MIQTAVGAVIRARQLQSSSQANDQVGPLSPVQDPLLTTCILFVVGKASVVVSLLFLLQDGLPVGVCRLNPSPPPTAAHSQPHHLPGAVPFMLCAVRAPLYTPTRVEEATLPVTSTVTSSPHIITFVMLYSSRAKVS